MKRVYRKRIFKILALLLTVALFLGLGQMYYFRQFDKNQLRFQGFYMEEKNSLDVVLMGASEVYTGFSSAAAYDSFGFTSYPYAIEANPVSLWKNQLTEIMNCQTPKLIVIEVNGAIYDEKGLFKDASIRRFVENIPMSENKIQTLQSLKAELKDDMASYYLPFLKYHGKWMKMGTNLRGARDTLAMQLRGYSLLKGAYTNTGCKPFDQVRDISGDTSVAELNQTAEYYLRDFLEYCKNMEIDNIVFVRFPHRITTDKSYKIFQKCNRVGQIVREYGYDYLDFEMDSQAIGFDYSKDFYNDEHMNAYGQQKFTEYFGKYLVEHYGIEKSVLSEKSQKRWETSAEYIRLFYEYFDKCKKDEPDKERKLMESADLIEELNKLKN